MISPQQAKQKTGRLYERRFAEWMVNGWATPVVDIPLHPPTQETVLADTATATQWRNSWREAEQQLPADSLVWESRQWASAGAQRVPARLVLKDPGDLAAFTGRRRHWAAAQERGEELIALLGTYSSAETISPAETVPDAVRRRLKKITDLAPPEYTRVREALAWLLTNPQPGVYPRQMPIRGVDSKWLEKNSALVEPLYTAATGSASLGLLNSPGLIRLRFLDPALAPGGLRDLAAPAAELDRLTIAPTAVLMIENLQSMLALPQMDGVVALHSAGYAARNPAAMEWLQGRRLVYWGDLDVDGYRILDMVRTKLPQTRSILMDRSTLKAHLDLAVNDRKDAPRTVPAHLTGAERDGFAALQDYGSVRLEQERIPWDYALSALQQSLSGR